MSISAKADDIFLKLLIQFSSEPVPELNMMGLKYMIQKSIKTLHGEIGYMKYDLSVLKCISIEKKDENSLYEYHAIILLKNEDLVPIRSAITTCNDYETHSCAIHVIQTTAYLSNITK